MSSTRPWHQCDVIDGNDSPTSSSSFRLYQDPVHCLCFHGNLRASPAMPPRPGPRGWAIPVVPSPLPQEQLQHAHVVPCKMVGEEETGLPGEPPGVHGNHQPGSSDAPLPRLQLLHRQETPPCGALHALPGQVSVYVPHPVADSPVKAAVTSTCSGVILGIVCSEAQLDVKVPHLVLNVMARNVHVAPLPRCGLPVDPVVHRSGWDPTCRQYLAFCRHRACRRCPTCRQHRACRRPCARRQRPT